MNVGNEDAAKGLDVAVIGMGCRFPDAEDHHAFWQNIKNGRESIRFCNDEELRGSGIPQDVIENPKFVRTGGSKIAKFSFDHEFFGLSLNRARTIDPHARVLLECTYHALEDAGFTKGTVGRVGLFLASSSSLVYHVLERMERPDETLSEISISDFIAATLGFQGPSMMIDTACSSSLVAIHLAARSVLLGECDMAIAGGCSLNLLSPKGYVYHDGLIRSVDGHCRAFDANATGTIGGEGAGVVVVKPLNKAIISNDNIQAVIRGSAINNDGNGKIGFTAPSVNGQADVIKQALKYACITGDTVEFVEAHGTGTQLGDPIEIEALTRAYAADVKAKCAIGSVKANIGHLDPAAGVAGFVKTVLALKHKIIPPAVNFSSPNPKCSFDTSPFFINTRASEWKSSTKPRRAGVSSFGIGGTNAHVVLEEAIRIHGAKHDHEFAYLISANTIEGLKKLIKKNLEVLEIDTDIDLASWAYTSQVGREALPIREACIFSSREDLMYQLRKLESSISSEINQTQHRSEKIARDTNLEALVNAWLMGEAVNWNALYPNEKPNKVSLPLYPFNRTELSLDIPRLLAELPELEVLITKLSDHTQ